YLTTVIEARDGTEQRIQLLGQSIREIPLSSLVGSAREVAETMVRFFTGGQMMFGIPYWPDLTPLTAGVALGAATLPCDTTGRIFKAGDLIVVWQDSRTWESLTVQTVNPSSLVVTSPTTRAWTQGNTMVAPLLQARLSQAAEIAHPSMDISEDQAVFTTEPV